jgi:peptidoglycan/xylan/chitin deacetylase (PgdA/CDA1 family)
MRHKINILFLVVGVLSVQLFVDDPKFKWTCTLIIIGVFLFFLFLGVLTLRLNYFLPAVHKINSKEVLLTFDDGPDPEFTPQILEILKENDIKSIFFIIGSKAEKHPNIISKILSDGHLIANHTYTHSNLFPLFSSKKVFKEIQLTNDIIRNISGKENLFFRPPIGYTNPIIARAVSSMELTLIGWSGRSYDTVLTSVDLLKKRVLKISKPGRIILLHDNLRQTRLMLPLYLAEAKKNGIIFVNEKSLSSLSI